MSIKYFDMFAGIGGFRSGLEAVGGFKCVGYCEIDKYAKQAYEAIYGTRGEKQQDSPTADFIWKRIIRLLTNIKAKMKLRICRKSSRRALSRKCKLC